MEFVNIFDFIQKTYLILVAVVGVIGYGLKQTTLVKDNYIPIILIILGGVLGALMSQHTDINLFDSIMQGLLCGGASVAVNQVPKQLKKLK